MTVNFIKWLYDQYWYKNRNLDEIEEKCNIKKNMLLNIMKGFKIKIRDELLIDITINEENASLMKKRFLVKSTKFY